jgi:hypothetical protein
MSVETTPNYSISKIDEVYSLFEIRRLFKTLKNKEEIYLEIFNDLKHILPNDTEDDMIVFLQEYLKDFKNNDDTTTIKKKDFLKSAKDFDLAEGNHEPKEDECDEDEPDG